MSSALLCAAISAHAAWRAGLQTITLTGSDINKTSFSAAATNVVLCPEKAKTTSGWGASTTYVYWGQIYLDGSKYTFAESIDDKVYLKVDGVTLLDNGNWDKTTVGSITRDAGWYDFEVRFYNGSGGAGPSNKDSWGTTAYGFGYNTTNYTGKVGAKYTFPEDPGDRSLFRYDDGKGFANQILFSGEPYDVPVEGVSYGLVSGLVAGAEQTYSVPSGLQGISTDVRASCVGWNLYSRNIETDERTLVSSNTTTTATFTHADGVTWDLVWLWKLENRVVATAGAGGSISAAELWVADGEAVTLAATPEEGKAFSFWTGDVSNAAKYDNPLTLSFDDAPAAIVANFVTPGATWHWTGTGADALASTPENWQEGTAPPSLASIVFDAAGNAHPCTWDLDIPFQSWTQSGYTNIVTFQTVYSADGFNTLKILGDCTVTSGIWKHLPNTGTSKAYRLKVDVGGDMTIGPDAVIDVSGMGYMAHYRPFGVAKVSANEGASHGGRGFPNGTIATEPYGCYYAPEDPGNCGTWNNATTRKGSGGGIVTLAVGGALVHNGLITANAGKPDSHYGGAGGSVYIVAGSIRGTGRITSRPGDANYSGAGGRIAVRLTDAGAGFDDYDLVNLADATSPRTGNQGAPGTIYGETASDETGKGWLILKGNGTLPSITSCYATPFTKEYTSVALSRLTLTNNVLMRLDTGYTLDLTGTTVVADDKSVQNGIYVDGGTLVIDPAAEEITCVVKANTDLSLETGTLTIGKNGNLWAYNAPADVMGDLVIADGGKATATYEISVTGDATVLAGGIVTTTGPKTVPDTTLTFTVAGDLTVAEGGTISASGKGYSAGSGPVVNGGNSGSSHGGWGHGGAGTCTVPPYGSVVDPRTHGAAGMSGSGGGVILLTVGGALRNDGTIASDGVLGSSHYGAAGGSVNITAASLAGAATGHISASAEAAMHCSQCLGGVSGGGRVAVTLTGAGSDFGGYAGTIKARGSRWNASSVAGGAGTIYLRERGQGIDAGRLIIDGDGASSCYVTVLGGDVEGAAFGAVTITNGANVALAANAGMTVSRGWANHGTFTAGVGSEVTFAGADNFAYAGSTTFANISSMQSGKRVVFADGATLAATGAISFAGASDAKLVLDSADASSTWTLDVPAATFSDLEVNGCQSATEVFVANGFGERNNENVIFGEVAAGVHNIWTGAVDANWSVAGNWQEGRIPIATDIVEIPDGTAHSPGLAASVTVAGLSVARSAGLSFNGKTLTVSGATASSGTLDFSAGGSLEAQGAVSVSGSVLGGTLLLDASAAQTVALTDVAFTTVDVLSPAVSFRGVLEASTLQIGDGTTAISASFANGMTVKATDFIVSGDASSAPVTLACASAGGAWLLNAVSADVAGATVSGSDASSGVLVVPSGSTDAGGNTNWLFNDTRARWTGAVDNAFEEAGNWTSGVVPGASDDVVIADSGVVVVSSDTAVKSLSVESGASLTVKAHLAVSGSVSIGDAATLVWDVPGAIGGNLAVLPGGTLTHSRNTTTEASKLDLAIAGSGYIAAGGAIDVTGRGYAYSGGARGPGGGPSNSTGNTGASYGGRGYGGAGGVAKPCYGSYLCPTNCGSSGSWESGGAGGGAIHLAFDGGLVVDGEIAADGGKGGSYYTGSGGSIWISAESLDGTGAIRATGTPSGGNTCFGGGGRIALYTRTTGDIAASFGGTILAHGGYLYTSGRGINGSAGTVYLENGAAKPGRGWVRIANRTGYTSRDTSRDKTDLPSPSLCDPAETENVHVLVEEYGTLNLTADTQISDLQTDDTARIQLNGYTLTIRSREHSLPGTVVVGGTTESPGRIVWLPRDAALMIMLY